MEKKLNKRRALMLTNNYYGLNAFCPEILERNRSSNKTCSKTLYMCNALWIFFLEFKMTLNLLQFWFDDHDYIVNIKNEISIEKYNDIDVDVDFIDKLPNMHKLRVLSVWS